MMAGLEVVVRPVVFPNIRPAPAQPVRPADDPDKGFAVIKGNGGKQVTLTYSYSMSASTANQKEIKRRVDVARVYQKTDDGAVNHDNFVDIEVANKFWMKGAPSQERDTGTTAPGFVGTERVVNSYDRITERDNVKIRKKDVIRQSGTTAPGYAGTD